MNNPDPESATRIDTSNLRDESSRREWRRIAKEGRDFLALRLAESKSVEDAQKFRNAVQKIKADHAVLYDWETPCRESLHELQILDELARDKAWIWEETFTHPQRLTAVKLLENEYRASENDNLAVFTHIPAKNGETHGGAIILATCNTWFAESVFRNQMVIKPIWPDQFEMKIHIALWHKANLIINPNA
jgi:hypothetical protein